jgi:hypothetical protein
MGTGSGGSGGTAGRNAGRRVRTTQTGSSDFRIRSIVAYRVKPKQLASGQEVVEKA